MFYGSYVHNLDNKNRLVIPSKMRGLIGDKLFILKGYDGCLALYCEADFKAYLSSLASLPYLDKNSRDVERIALSTVSELEVDNASRIQIPTALVNKYQISKEVVVIGMLDHIEVWSKAKWDEYVKENEADYEAKSEQLLKKNND